jgi:hypothetical protein
VEGATYLRLYVRRCSGGRRHAPCSPKSIPFPDCDCHGLDSVQVTAFEEEDESPFVGMLKVEAA